MYHFSSVRIDEISNEWKRKIQIRNDKIEVKWKIKTEWKMEVQIELKMEIQLEWKMEDTDRVNEDTDRSGKIEEKIQKWKTEDTDRVEIRMEEIR
ncbi:hypothetical protein AVEN_33676-1 [Araneus ventricosus]|uniref:Uncharacterized protein n=1 Tax=Araneus ventricosus TaxID=182803 RepID=A0A4Y2TDY6_ARAVE|nr:hypothetical protein AVEN_33676-1 [Araneus ventricosus]